MKTIQQHLGWKLFISYLVIIVVGVVSLAVTAELHTPTAINRHMAEMSVMMGGGMGMMTDLTENFTQAINEVLFVAASLAFVAAVLVSTFVTRRIVKPVQEMKTASQRIANGRYEERVDKTSGSGAFEVLVDPVTRSVFPEPGPNMMWNTEYGMMSGSNFETIAGMMGGQFDSGMMGNSQYNSGMMGGNMMGSPRCGNQPHR